MIAKRDTLLNRAKEIAELSATTEKELKKMKKEDLLAEHIQLLNWLQSIEVGIANYIDDQADQKTKKALSDAQKYKAMWEADHKLLAEVQNAKRKESPGRPTKYGSAASNEVLALHEAGSSIREIAAKLNMSPTTVGKLLRRVPINK